MASLPNVIIVELSSQYTLLIERTLRELGVRSAIFDPKRSAQYLERNSVKAVILSGGAASVYDECAPQPPSEIFSLRLPDGRPVPILGICYGMQWIAHHLGGNVKPVLGQRHYGPAEIRTEDTTSLFRGCPTIQAVWASHGDSVVETPTGFRVIARSDSDGIAAMVDSGGAIWGVQFHPEVTHTPSGKTILTNFVRHIAGCENDWQPSSIVSAVQKDVVSRLDKGKAVIGFSGGVDSTTLSTMLSPILGDRLLAVMIDGGQLREKEIDEIVKHAQDATVTLKIVRARREFSEVMSDVTDAEEKRRHFKKVYAACLVGAAESFGATTVIQGTLAPDRIESGTTGGATIKSHHNVGLDLGNLEQLHPIGHLFKYEIRALAQELGLPESVWSKHPFPGPGLFLRAVGTSPTPETLDIVRWADARVREILEKHGVYKELSQLVVAYVGANTVGVKGDNRVYTGAVVVRAVETVDFMTAKGILFCGEIVDEIESTLTRHQKIVRVWYDPTKKPPATVELE